MPAAQRKTAQAVKAVKDARRAASSVSEWKKTPEPIELPSGKWMSLRSTSLAILVQTGQIPNTLMSVIQGQVNLKNGKAKKSSDQVMSEITEDPKALQDLFSVVDTYVCLVAIQPKVYPALFGDALRSEDRLYVDEIDASDKMYIFQRSIGGTADLESFRRELATGMDLVQQREEVVDPPKRPARRARAV